MMYILHVSFQMRFLLEFFQAYGALENTGLILFMHTNHMPIQTPFPFEFFEANVTRISSPCMFCMYVHISSARRPKLFATPFTRKSLGFRMDGFNVSLNIGGSGK